MQERPTRSCRLFKCRRSQLPLHEELQSSAAGTIGALLPRAGAQRQLPWNSLTCGTRPSSTYIIQAPATSCNNNKHRQLPAPLSTASRPAAASHPGTRRRTHAEHAGSHAHSCSNASTCDDIRDLASLEVSSTSSFIPLTVEREKQRHLVWRYHGNPGSRYRNIAALSRSMTARFLRNFHISRQSILTLTFKLSLSSPGK